MHAGPDGNPEGRSEIPAPTRAPKRPWEAFTFALRSAGAATHALVALMALAVIVFARIQVLAEDERRTDLTLAEIETHVQRMSALEWRVMAERRLTPEVEWGLERVRQGMSKRLATIQDVADTDPLAAHVVTTYRNFVKHVDAEMELQRAGRTEDAEAYDERNVDPAFEVLMGALASARQVHERRARDSRHAMLAGLLLVALLALTALTVLALRATRSRTRADAAEAGQREWRASEQRFRELFESNPQPMWVLDTGAQRFLAVNDAALALYGFDRSTFLRLAFGELCVAGGCDAGAGWSAAGATRVLGAEHARRDGTRVTVDVVTQAVVHEGRPALLAVVRDASERQRLEQRIREAQRLETLGRLAGGVAHDFNNLVTAIVGYTQLLITELRASGSASANGYAHEAWTTARRAASLTQQMINFGRTRARSSEPIALGVVVGELQPMLMRLLGEDVLLQVSVAPGAWRVRGDRGLFEQMVMNLAVRARESMPRGGRLTLALQGVMLEGAEARRLGALAGGAHVELLATDSGARLDDAALARLSDPRATSDPLAPEAPLMAVRDLARGLGGACVVENDDVRGTVVRVLLPRDAGAETAATTEPAAAKPASAPTTLLLVEDDGPVRDVIRRQLEALGYRVLECANGERALAIANAHDGPIDLMITDVVMPGLNGRELAEALLASRPDLRVLYMSGYTDDRLVRQGVQESRLAFLPKPFEIDQLAARIEELLGTSRAAA